MGWLSSFFSFDTASQRSRKGQVFSSTHEAFSLPTSSPIFASHADAFNPDGLNTPDPESARPGAQYTYPPRGASAYGYIPSTAGLGGRQQGSSSLLPTHMDALHSPLSPSAAYPPLSKTWTRLRNWLSREYPELGDTLNYGILPQDLAEIELRFGLSLPSVVRESYLCVDGQEPESAAGCSEGLFFGLTLLPLESVLEEWRFWREVDDDPTTGANPSLHETQQSIPPGWVRKDYSQRGWIPLIADKAGNYVGVDLNPAEGGSVGQVIIFGRDFDTKVVLWRGDGPTGWAKWLASFVEELESGDGFELGPNDAGEGSEDDVGYEGYFYGGTAPGQGDGLGGGGGTSGGLRYTGEYRGWNVLEAWADRSFRRWYDAGLIPEEVLRPPEGDVPTVVEPGVDINQLAQQGTGTEIPIPVISSPSEPLPPPTVSALNPPRSTEHRSSRSNHVPKAQSTSKVPAPRPVELPTVQDIVPPSSSHSSLDDIETGQAPYEDIGLVSATRRVGQTPRRSGSDSSTVLPLSPTPMSPMPETPRPIRSSARKNHTSRLSAVTDRTASPPLPPAPAVSASPPQDLLAESTPGLPFVPLMESSPVSGVNGLTDEPIAEEPQPDTTIRLVGGQSGAVEPSASLLGDTDDKPEESKRAAVKAEAPSVASGTGSNADASRQKVHKKKTSSTSSATPVAASAK